MPTAVGYNVTMRGRSTLLSGKMLLNTQCGNHTCLACGEWKLCWLAFFCFLLEVVNSTRTHFDCTKCIDSCLIIHALQNFPRDVLICILLGFFFIN